MVRALPYFAEAPPPGNKWGPGGNTEEVVAAGEGTGPTPPPRRWARPRGFSYRPPSLGETSIGDSFSFFFEE